MLGLDRLSEYTWRGEEEGLLHNMILTAGSMKINKDMSLHLLLNLLVSITRMY